ARGRGAGAADRHAARSGCGVSAPFAVRVATAADLAGLAGLFEAAASPCYCRYWHFDGGKNAWLSRCYVEIGTSRRELEVDLERGAPEAQGLVALAPPPEGGAPRVVGWLKVAPAAVVRKAYEQRIYRALPCFEGDRA